MSITSRFRAIVAAFAITGFLFACSTSPAHQKYELLVKLLSRNIATSVADVESVLGPITDRTEATNVSFMSGIHPDGTVTMSGVHATNEQAGELPKLSFSVIFVKDKSYFRPDVNARVSTHKYWACFWPNTQGFNVFVLFDGEAAVGAGVIKL
jgi:hypothetical protein